MFYVNKHAHQLGFPSLITSCKLPVICQEFSVCISSGIMYVSQTPQIPMVRPYAHDYFKIDNYPHGTNAVICVISYTVREYI